VENTPHPQKPPLPSLGRFPKLEAMTNTRLDQLLEKKKKIEAQIQQQRAREREQERKADTRRKIIAGALALEHMDANPDSDFAAVMARLINRYTTRPGDRALFGLPPLGEGDESAREDFEKTSAGGGA